MKKKKQSYGVDVDRALDLWVKLSRAYASFSKKSAYDIAGFGLTPPQFALFECLGHLGPLTLGELSRKMLVSGGNVTVIVDNLEKQGLLERVHDNADRRTIYVRLTKNGMKLFKQTFRRHAKYIASIASVLAPEEQRELSALLKKLGVGIRSQKE